MLQAINVPVHVSVGLHLLLQLPAWPNPCSFSTRERGLVQVREGIEATSAEATVHTHVLHDCR